MKGETKNREQKNKMVVLNPKVSIKKKKIIRRYKKHDSRI